MVELFLCSLGYSKQSNMLSPGGLGTVIYSTPAENEGIIHFTWPFPMSLNSTLVMVLHEKHFLNDH